MGFGFARDGMNSLKLNRSQKTSNKKKFKEGQETYLKNRGSLNFKQISEEDLEKFKRKLKIESKKENLRTAIIVILVLGVLAGLISYVLL